MKVSVNVRLGTGYKPEEYNVVTRVLSKELAPGLYSVIIETRNKNPAFAQYVTGGNLHVHGIEVFSDIADGKHVHTKVELEMPANAVWHKDAVEGRYQIQVWIYDASIFREGFTTVWDKAVR